MMNMIPVLVSLIILVLVARGIYKLAKSRGSTKMAIKLMVLYGFLLALSPVVAAIVLQDSQGPAPVPVPPFYFQTVLESDENVTLSGLLEDENLHLLEVTRVAADPQDFSPERPLRIATRYKEHDDGYYGYQYQMVVEVTAEVDRVEITQLIQRIFINDVEISGEFIPWTWTVAEDQLRPFIHPTEIIHHQVSPHPHLFHFAKDKPVSLTRFPHENLSTSITTGGVIQWIRVPADLPFEIQGPAPHRFIE